MNTWRAAAAGLFLILASGPARAEYFYLKDGDRISGDVLESADGAFKIKMYYTGAVVDLDKGIIDRVETNDEHARKLNQAPPAPGTTAANPLVPPSAPSPKYWEHKLAAGYQASNGNSKNSAAHLNLDSHYKKDRNEWTVKGEWDYGSDHGRMNVQKFFAKAQNNSRLAGDQRWFYSRTFEIDHDRFADIDYRLLPSLGMGYWFTESDRSKAEADLGIGWEYTNYADETKSTNNPTLIPHAYFDKTLIGRLKAAEDFTFYPSLSHFARYRLRSESSLINPITDTLSWKLSFIDEFNADPRGDFKKNDTTFVTSIEYSF